ncbi:Hypothetical protein PHPALM_5068 [Phytophthora palmivora]|uniref:Elongator complex protein 5 n=1 Tax=Phytophthora palmivora TaxID=4796 RepID=A0A2P4YI99_9STRA|nr:Hypothetical protein PHPALM_5068 [Phytophthora palmivora]
MEEFLLHHCVTSDVTKSANNDDQGSMWQTSSRAECVLVQENRQAHGASRVILSSMLQLTLQSFKTTNVLLLTLESPQVADDVEASAKFSHVDYSADAAHFQSSSSKSQLLTKMMLDIERVEAKIALNGATSARPMVVVLDSLNALLQQTSLQQVLLFLRRLRSHAVVGSVIARLNAGAESLKVAQALAAQATALNGRSSESIEYFQVLGSSIKFVAPMDADHDTTAVDPTPKRKTNITTEVMKGAKQSEFKRKTQSDSKPSLLALQNQPESLGQAPLPVRQEEVSFNLSISDAEQRAKSQVQLPYMHQGGVSSGSNATNPGSISGNIATSASNNSLFFIDEDDPDWDDDDLDDDLDI